MGDSNANPYPYAALFPMARNRVAADTIGRAMVRDRTGMVEVKGGQSRPACQEERHIRSQKGRDAKKLRLIYMNAP